jgi:4-hydroxy-2-oxoglutarate aldolase
VACGNALVFYPALCAGAVGGVLAVANCVPRATAALYRAFAAGDHARARRIQEALLPLAATISTSYGVAGLKVAMRLAGFRGGEVRAPLLPPPASAVDEIRLLLDRAEAAV